MENYIILGGIDEEKGEGYTLYREQTPLLSFRFGDTPNDMRKNSLKKWARKFAESMLSTEEDFREFVANGSEEERLLPLEDRVFNYFINRVNFEVGRIQQERKYGIRIPENPDYN